MLLRNIPYKVPTHPAFTEGNISDFRRFSQRLPRNGLRQSVRINRVFTEGSIINSRHSSQRLCRNALRQHVRIKATFTKGSISNFRHLSQRLLRNGLERCVRIDRDFTRGNTTSFRQAKRSCCWRGRLQILADSREGQAYQRIISAAPVHQQDAYTGKTHRQFKRSLAGMRLAMRWYQ
jgi:hypothetical protein